MIIRAKILSDVLLPFFKSKKEPLQKALFFLYGAKLLSAEAEI